MPRMLERYITKLETAPMSIAGWLAAFAGIVWVRYFLEAFSSPNVSGFVPSDMPTLLHYALFYLAAVVVTVVVVGTVSRLPLLPMMRTLIFILPLMWLAPLIDLANGGAHMAYLFAASPFALLKDFFTYFGPFTAYGITLGLRIELGLLIFMLGAFVFIKTKKLSKAFLGMVVGYVVIFASVSLPSVMGFFLPANASGAVFAGSLSNALVSHNFLHPSETYTAYRTLELLFDASMAQTWFVILVIAGGAWLYLVRKNVMVAMIRNIRPERAIHFIIFAFLGGLIALSEGTKVNWTVLDFITIVVAALTIIFAWAFAVITNDLVDESIDTVSNTDRPLVTGTLSSGMMRDAALVCGVMTTLGALALGSYALFWMLVFSAAYYIYSVPPLRLKRIPILASAFIGVATLATMLLGFFLISTNQGLAAFPSQIALLVVLFMTLITNVRDLKDIKGDNAAGIWTIPTLLGNRRARIVIGAMTFVAYALVPLFIPVPILWAPSLIIGVASWVGLVQGRGERFAFSLYFFYLASIILLLHFF